MVGCLGRGNCEGRRAAKEIYNITVVRDGGWSKRSHKHTYNAMGGVGAIYGHGTNKQKKKKKPASEVSLPSVVSTCK